MLNFFRNMLNKNDLSKQFELVVKQEIKNYQDSHNFVLQALKELKESIREVQFESSRNHALLHGHHEDNTIEMNSMKRACQSIGLQFQSFASDQKVLNGQHETIAGDYNEVFQKLSKQIEELKEKTEHLHAKIYDLNYNADTQKKIMEDSLNDLLFKFRAEIRKAKTEIFETPSEASLLRVDLENKLDCHKVDVAGIMRELNIFKIDNTVTQKNIENLYTQIERLKNK